MNARTAFAADGQDVSTDPSLDPVSFDEVNGNWDDVRAQLPLTRRDQRVHRRCGAYWLSWNVALKVPDCPPALSCICSGRFSRVVHPEPRIRSRRLS